MIEGVIANCAVQVQRMTTLADELEAGASVYEGCDRKNQEILDRLERETFPNVFTTGLLQDSLGEDHDGWGPHAAKEREVSDEKAEPKFEDPPPIDHWSPPHLDPSASILEAEQNRIEDITDQAKSDRLVVRDGYIEGPDESPDGMSSTGPYSYCPRAPVDHYRQRLEAFDAIADSMNELVGRLVTEAERLEDHAENVWDEVLHATTSFTSAGMELRKHQIKSRSLMANPISRIMARGSPAMTIIGFVYDIQTGESTGKAVLKGIGSFVGGASGFKAGIMLAGSFPVAGWVVAASGIIASMAVAGISSAASGQAYDHFDPETAHNRVQRHLESA